MRLLLKRFPSFGSTETSFRSRGHGRENSRLPGSGGRKRKRGAALKRSRRVHHQESPPGIRHGQPHCEQAPWPAEVFLRELCGIGEVAGQILLQPQELWVVAADIWLRKELTQLLQTI